MLRERRVRAVSKTGKKLLQLVQVVRLVQLVQNHQKLHPFAVASAEIRRLKAQRRDAG